MISEVWVITLFLLGLSCTQHHVDTPISCPSHQVDDWKSDIIVPEMGVTISSKKQSYSIPNIISLHQFVVYILS